MNSAQTHVKLSYTCQSFRQVQIVAEERRNEPGGRLQAQLPTSFGQLQRSCLLDSSYFYFAVFFPLISQLSLALAQEEYNAAS
jgi:hypothetical protein